jgi:hypothetical protein
MQFLSNRESPCLYCNRLFKTRDPIQGPIRSKAGAAGKTKVLYVIRRTRSNYARAPEKKSNKK